MVEAINGSQTHSRRINSPNGRDAAFERALLLARTHGAELYVLHVVPVLHRFSFRAAERLEWMMDMRQRAEAAGVRVHTVEQQGDPASVDNDVS